MCKPTNEQRIRVITTYYTTITIIRTNKFANKQNRMNSSVHTELEEPQPEPTLAPPGAIA